MVPQPLNRDGLRWGLFWVVGMELTSAFIIKHEDKQGLVNILLEHHPTIGDNLHQILESNVHNPSRRIVIYYNLLTPDRRTPK